MENTIRALHEAIASLDEEEADREEVETWVAKLLQRDPGLCRRTAPPEFPYPPLFTAVMVGDLGIVNQLLAAGGEPHARATFGDAADCFLAGDFRAAGNDRTLLHTAVAVDAPNLVELFLELGIDVNTPDGDGWTPLFVAATSGESEEVSPEVVDILLQHGADVGVTVGTEPLMDRAAEGNTYLVELLERRGVPLTPRAALRLRDPAKLRTVLRDHPALVPDDPDVRGDLCEQAVLLLRDLTFTPLEVGAPDRTRANAERMRRVLRDHIDILVALRPPNRGHRLCSALFTAVQMVGPEVAEVLLRCGARPTSALEENFLLSAARMNAYCAGEMVELLTLYGFRHQTDAPRPQLPERLYANVPPRLGHPEDPPEGRTVILDSAEPPAPTNPGDAVTDYLRGITDAFGKALREIDPDAPPPCLPPLDEPDAP